MNEKKPGSSGTPPIEAYSASRHTIQGAGENVNESGEAVNKATDSIKDLVAGNGNIVDTALAVKGAYDNVMGLSGRLSATAMMPVMKALSAFKGQAILPAGKQMDPVMGIDVHMVTIPPSPAPVPMPHPYIGILFNPKDWVSCLINTFKTAALDTLPPPAEDDKGAVASIAKNKEAIASIAMGLAGMSATVKFGGFIPRSVTGTKTKNVPHIPMGAGFHPAFAASVAKNDGKVFLGSLFVVADGDPMVGSFHLNYNCWDVGVVDLFKSQRAGAKKAPEASAPLAELFVPSGTIMPIPMGRPVLVNSIPTPINPMAIIDKLFKAGLGKLKAAAKKGVERGLTALRGKVNCGALSAVSSTIGTGQSHPVDVSGGYFYTNNVDFKLPGPIPLSWERVWYSNSDYNGPLGNGWHHSYDMALAVDDEAQKAILRMKDGRVAIFDLPTIEKETYNRSEKLTLYLHAEGYYYVSDVKSLLYRFSNKTCINVLNGTETFLLQSIANRNGFAIRFFYTDQGILNKIIDSANRLIIVNSNSEGRIINVQLPDPTLNGRTTFAATGYAYTGEGYMAQQSDALNQAMHYEYNNNLMVKEVWRNGCVWQFRYDMEKGYEAKCIEVWGTGGLLHYKFDYTDPQCTVVTNSRGFKKLFYHKNGVVIKHVDALGAEWEYHYNAYNELELETDPLGNQKSNTYDQWGNVATITEANGSFIQKTYGVGFFKHITYKGIDKSGGKWKRVYDNFGNLIKRINPINRDTNYEYIDGLLISITNANENKILLEYDNQFNLAKLISANGYEIEWSYDILGNCIKSLDSLGRLRKIDFNNLSLPEIIYEPDGNIRYFKFDNLGNLTHTEDKQYKIEFKYNFLNYLVSRKQAGNSVRYEYDTEGNLVSLTNEHDELYSFETDPADRIIKEIGFDGMTRSYQRNALGKITRVERPEDKYTEYCYNEIGKITEVRYYDSTFEKYDYSKDGLLSSAENSYSKMSFERDILGRVVKEISIDNFINYKYDILDNRIEITSSLGAAIYNEFDNFGNTTSSKANNWYSKINYNEIGLETKRMLPGNINIESIRNRNGRLINQNIKNSNSLVHNRKYTWDVSNRLQKVIDSTMGLTQFIHDELGNLSKTIYSDGQEQLRIPDAVENLFNLYDHTDRDYGKGGRLLRMNGIYYKYDLEGNLIEKKEKNGGTWKYSWNATGMLRSIIRPDGEPVTFIYDALGRRISKQYKNTITKWIWDGNKPLHEWKENAHTGEKLSDIIVGKNGIITWLFDENSFSPVGKFCGDKAYSIITDHLGTPYQMYNDSGEKFWESYLDSYGKVKNYKGDRGSCPFKYQGQYEDIETGLYYNRFRYYSSIEGIYLNQDPIRLYGGIRLYGYVYDTNMWIDKFGLNRTCDDINPVTGRPKGELQDLASQIREAGDHPITQNNRTIAVGMDENGDLYAGSSNGFDKGQRAKADELGIQRVPTKKDSHAEENLVAAVPDLKSVGTSRRDPCGPDEHNCAGQLQDKGINVDNL